MEDSLGTHMQVPEWELTNSSVELGTRLLVMECTVGSGMKPDSFSPCALICLYTHGLDERSPRAPAGSGGGSVCRMLSGVILPSPCLGMRVFWS